MGCALLFHTKRFSSLLCPTLNFNLSWKKNKDVIFEQFYYHKEPRVPLAPLVHDYSLNVLRWSSASFLWENSSMVMALPDSCANPIFCVQQMGTGTWQNVCRALVKLPPVNFSLSVWQEKRSSFQPWMCFLRMSYVYAGVRTQAQIVTVPWWWCTSFVKFPCLHYLWSVPFLWSTEMEKLSPQPENFDEN